jgi:hypothetical protein
MLLEQFRAVVREEIAISMSVDRQGKQLFTTRETAKMLNVEESWLATRARAGKIPHRMLGHYRYFSADDIDSIIANAYVPMVHSNNDAQGVQTDPKGAETNSGTAGETAGRDSDGGGEVGEGREADLGTGGAGDETLARKKVTGGENVSPKISGGKLGSQVPSRRPAKAKNISKLPRGGDLR